tara:strand:- start:107 stop:328 length:222 start_codon:yes stop_codon:yes gene_type:complete
MKKSALILLGLYLVFYFMPSLASHFNLFMVKQGYSSSDLLSLITFLATPILLMVFAIGISGKIEDDLSENQKT